MPDMIPSEATTAGRIAQSVEAEERCPRCGGPPTKRSLRFQCGYNAELNVDSVQCLRRQLAETQERAEKYEGLYRLWQFTARLSVDLPDEDAAMRLWAENDQLRRVVEASKKTLVAFEHSVTFSQMRWAIRGLRDALAGAPANPYAAVVEALAEADRTMRYAHDVMMLCNQDGPDGNRIRTVTGNLALGADAAGRALANLPVWEGVDS